MATIKLSREELYEKVWSTPMTKLSQEFAISDVALKKACKKLNVPTPPRGYWAQLAAGVNVPQVSLPKHAPEESLEVDLALNKQRQEALEAAKAAIPSDGPPRLSLPVGTERLHPITADLRRVLQSTKADDRGMASIRDKRLPAVLVSPNLADRTVRALSAVLSELETRGVLFKAATRDIGIGFWKGDDEIVLSTEEPIDAIEREPTMEEKRRPSWEWKTKTTQLSGKLGFLLCSPTGRTRFRAKWREGPRRELEVILHEIVEQVFDFFRQEEEWRKRDAEEKERRKQEEVLQAERERKAAHQRNLADSADARLANLVCAAEWWRLRQVTHDFIGACEQTWRDGSITLTPEQEAWLSWARAEADRLSPVKFGYPRPKEDGPIIPETVPFGGPYPKTDTLPTPPTFPKPPSASGYHSGWQTPDPKPYPYWLRHR